MQRWTSACGITITALKDGDWGAGPDTFRDLDARHRDNLLAHAGETRVRGAFNAFVLTGPDLPLTLVDCGGGTAMGDIGGRVVPALAAMGVAPADIRQLFLTHLHTDHCGGALRADGTRVFDRAEVLLTTPEPSFWTGQDHIATRFLAAYADQVRTVSGQAVLAPGLTVWPLPGHTPGHAGLLIGDDAALVGDIVHAEHLQLPDPAICTVYDQDAVLATATRRAALQRLAEEGRVFGGGHLLWPAPLTRIVATGDGFARLPSV